MKRRNYAIAAGLVLVLFICGYFWGYHSSTVYIVRHAERNNTITHDPPLSSQGQQRANDLATLLSSKSIGFIYSTDSLRTRSTAQPLATLRGLQILIYPKGTTPVQSSALPRRDGKNILIVGHSETILTMFSDLGGTSAQTSINGNDYDNLLSVTVHRFLWIKWTSSTETTYGALSP